ncbi:hypothetical protein T07_5429 [Trichinella nelsoni]|uniref:Uncharacterized protein n=1 Tax=Trichinella nelsoni TaxID=6336 RepID=A0A0V0REC7_9BILA|nr:hypothetical protein T07_5429 [Trichinella nelsoni]
MEQKKCENTDETKQNKRREEYQRHLVNYIFCLVNLVCQHSQRVCLYFSHSLCLRLQFSIFHSVRLELILRPENFPINSNRFLSLQYANEDPLKIALSLLNNGALVCLTCTASNSIVKRQTFALSRPWIEALRLDWKIN